MNNQEYLTEFRNTVSRMVEITTAKNHDYCASSKGTGDERYYDAFANFGLVEKLGIASKEKAVLVRMSDKMSRICSLLDREGMVADEKIEDTLIDLANYAIILKIMLTAKKQASQAAVKSVFDGRVEVPTTKAYEADPYPVR